MANSIAVMNTVIDFWGLLLPVGRRAVEEFFKAFMFLFVLPNVSDETEQHAIFTADHEGPRFRPGLNQPRHETVAGILSPEGLCLLLSRGDANRNAELGAARHNNTNALQFAKSFKSGWSPEKMLPLALEKS
jgi:hypothetical protein